jgi:ATP-binding cassette subfamily B protein
MDTYGIHLLDNGELHDAAYRVLFKGVGYYIGLILVMALLKFICAFFMRYIIMSVANKIEYELKNEIYAHCQYRQPSFYSKNNTGYLMTLMTEDVAKVKLYVGPAIFFGLNALVLFLILIPYAIGINARLTLYAMLPIAVLLFVVWYIKDFLYKRSEMLQERLANVTTLAQETFAGIRVVQGFVCEENFISRFSKETERCKQAAMRLTAVNVLPMPLAIGINGLGIVLVVWIGLQEVTKGTLTMGNIAEFVMYMHLMTWPVITISLVSSYTQRAVASQKRINQLLTERNTIVSTSNLALPIQGHIAFEAVTFSYPDAAMAALKGATFTVEAGQAVLILGMMGSGKSTIAQLLVRFYDPLQGRILVDGVLLGDYHIAFLRDQIGYAPQDMFLFPDTIGNNITFGNKDATKAELEQAVEYAGLHHTLQQLPHGLDTMVGERGVMLSGGQKQRISLARALIRNPRILILDDTLSAVDVHTERGILNNLKTVMQGRTTLMISHKLTAASLFDKIIVLHDGCVAEQGTYAELLAAKGYCYQASIQQHMEHNF